MKILLPFLLYFTPSVLLANTIHGIVKDTKGNSILVNLKSNKFLFIGEYIYTFDIKNDDVVKYFSLIGNNESPYPVILGKNNVYFMLDKCYVPKTVFSEKMSIKDWENAYYYFYGHNRKYDKKKRKYIGKSIEEEFSKKMDNIKIIL